MGRTKNDKETFSYTQSIGKGLHKKALHVAAHMSIATGKQFNLQRLTEHALSEFVLAYMKKNKLEVNE